MRLDNLSSREGLLEQSSHARLDLRTHTATIEIDGIDVRIAQLRQQFVIENPTELIIRYMKGIEAHRVNLYLRGIAIRLKACPISLCTTTISNQNRHYIRVFM